MAFSLLHVVGFSWLSVTERVRSALRDRVCLDCAYSFLSSVFFQLLSHIMVYSFPRIRDPPVSRGVSLQVKRCADPRFSSCRKNSRLTRHVPCIRKENVKAFFFRGSRLFRRLPAFRGTFLPVMKQFPRFPAGSVSGHPSRTAAAQSRFP